MPHNAHNELGLFVESFIFSQNHVSNLGVWLTHTVRRKPSLLDQAYVSRKSRKLFGPENFLGLFSGALLRFRKVFLKAPNFRPIFSGIFSGFVAREVAQAEIFQPVISVKLTVDNDALSWFPQVREVRIKIQNFV